MTRLEPTASPILRMEGVSKRYGGVRALANADLAVFAGRIHAILGENGAGKSTLIKILSGVVAPDAGRIVLDGAEVAFDSPAAANRAGIVCIFQELSLVPDLSVADNIAISNPPRRFGLIDRRAQRRLAEEALERAGAPDIHPMALVKDLPLSRRQMVEIAKALARKPRVLILDEATSALTAADVAKVFVVLKRLRQEGLALLFISHRMHEIAELADESTVFRNGANVATYVAGTKTDNEVVEMMIGREYSHIFPPKPAARAKGADAAVRSQEPQLGGPAARHFVHRRRGRGRRPRRSRRAGPAGIAAGFVRRPARRLGRDPGGRRARVAFEPARGEGRSASAWR